MFKPINKQSFFYRFIASLLVFTFSFTSLQPPRVSYAQSPPATILNLPLPGTMLAPSPGFTPALIRGITFHPENPLEFDFIVNTGDTGIQEEELRIESTKLIKYFLASLTVPEDELWVNLSPYEKNRIIPDKFGLTEMGRDLLAQDYLLKQLTASLIYPEDELGKKFWKRVHKKVYEKFGTTDIPMNTFNKVWIVADRAVVYEQGQSAYVVDSHLKVMLEEDYLALQVHMDNTKFGTDQLSDNKSKSIGEVSSAIVRDIIIPEIEKEVNKGETFNNLRQIYHSMILATWYKQKLQHSLLNQVYADQNKIKGIDVEDKEIKNKIFQQYLDAFEKGVYDFIKEDYDPATKEIVPRKYFSGGLRINVPSALETINENDTAMSASQLDLVIKGLPVAGNHLVKISLIENATDDLAMAVEGFGLTELMIGIALFAIGGLVEYSEWKRRKKLRDQFINGDEEKMLAAAYQLKVHRGFGKTKRMIKEALQTRDLTPFIRKGLILALRQMGSDVSEFGSLLAMNATQEERRDMADIIIEMRESIRNQLTAPDEPVVGKWQRIRSSFNEPKEIVVWESGISITASDHHRKSLASRIARHMKMELPFNVRIVKSNPYSNRVKIVVRDPYRTNQRKSYEQFAENLDNWLETQEDALKAKDAAMAEMPRGIFNPTYGEIFNLKLLVSYRDDGIDLLAIHSRAQVEAQSQIMQAALEIGLIEKSVPSSPESLISRDGGSMEKLRALMVRSSVYIKERFMVKLIDELKRAYRDKKDDEIERMAAEIADAVYLLANNHEGPDHAMASDGADSHIDSLINHVKLSESPDLVRQAAISLRQYWEHPRAISNIVPSLLKFVVTGNAYRNTRDDPYIQGRIEAAETIIFIMDNYSIGNLVLPEEVKDVIRANIIGVHTLKRWAASYESVVLALHKSRIRSQEERYRQLSADYLLILNGMDRGRGSDTAMIPESKIDQLIHDVAEARLDYDVLMRWRSVVRGELAVVQAKRAVIEVHSLSQEEMIDEDSELKQLEEKLTRLLDNMDAAIAIESVWIDLEYPHLAVPIITDAAMASARSNQYYMERFERAQTMEILGWDILDDIVGDKSREVMELMLENGLLMRVAKDSDHYIEGADLLFIPWKDKRGRENDFYRRSYKPGFLRLAGTHIIRDLEITITKEEEQVIHQRLSDISLLTALLDFRRGAKIAPLKSIEGLIRSLSKKTVGLSHDTAIYALERIGQPAVGPLRRARDQAKSIKKKNLANIALKAIREPNLDIEQSVERFIEPRPKRKPRDWAMTARRNDPPEPITDPLDELFSATLSEDSAVGASARIRDIYSQLSSTGIDADIPVEYGKEETALAQIMDKFIQYSLVDMLQRTQGFIADHVEGDDSGMDQLTEVIDGALLEYEKRLQQEFPDIATMDGLRHVADVAMEISGIKMGTFVKDEKLKNLLLQNPPVELMRYFEVESLEQLLSIISVRVAFSLARYLESDAWIERNRINAVFLNAEDFEERDIEIVIFDKLPDKAVRFFNKKLPFSQDKIAGTLTGYTVRPGKENRAPILRSLTRALHYLYEIRFYTRIFNDRIYERVEDGRPLGRYVSDALGDKLDIIDFFEPHALSEVLFMELAIRALQRYTDIAYPQALSGLPFTLMLQDQNDIHLTSVIDRVTVLSKGGESDLHARRFLRLAILINHFGAVDQAEHALHLLYLSPEIFFLLIAIGFNPQRLSPIKVDERTADYEKKVAEYARIVSHRSNDGSDGAMASRFQPEDIEEALQAVRADRMELIDMEILERLVYYELSIAASKDVALETSAEAHDVLYLTPSELRRKILGLKQLLASIRLSLAIKKGAKAHTPRRRVMLVTNDLESGLRSTSAFYHFRYDLTVVTSVNEAFDELSDQGPFTALIIDSIDGDKSHFDWVKTLLEEFPDLPIALTSTQSGFIRAHDLENVFHIQKQPMYGHERLVAEAIEINLIDRDLKDGAMASAAPVFDEDQFEGLVIERLRENNTLNAKPLSEFSQDTSEIINRLILVEARMAVLMDINKGYHWNTPEHAELISRLRVVFMIRKQLITQLIATRELDAVDYTPADQIRPGDVVIIQEESDDNNRVLVAPLPKWGNKKKLKRIAVADSAMTGAEFVAGIATIGGGLYAAKQARDRFTVNGNLWRLIKAPSNENALIYLLDHAAQETIRFAIGELKARYRNDADNIITALRDLGVAEDEIIELMIHYLQWYIPYIYDLEFVRGGKHTESDQQAWRYSIDYLKRKAITSGSQILLTKLERISHEAKRFIEAASAGSKADHTGEIVLEMTPKGRIVYAPRETPPDLKYLDAAIDKIQTAIFVRGIQDTSDERDGAMAVDPVTGLIAGGATALGLWVRDWHLQKKWGSVDLISLIWRIRDEDHGSAVYKDAVTRLKKLKSPIVVPQLVELLAHPDKNKRGDVYYILREYKPRIILVSIDINQAIDPVIAVNVLEQMRDEYLTDSSVKDRGKTPRQYGSSLIRSKPEEFKDPNYLRTAYLLALHLQVDFDLHLEETLNIDEFLRIDVRRKDTQWLIPENLDQYLKLIWQMRAYISEMIGRLRPIVSDIERRREEEREREAQAALREEQRRSEAARRASRIKELGRKLVVSAHLRERVNNQIRLGFRTSLSDRLHEVSMTDSIFEGVERFIKTGLKDIVLLDERENKIEEFSALAKMLVEHFKIEQSYQPHGGFHVRLNGGFTSEAEVKDLARRIVTWLEAKEEAWSEELEVLQSYDDPAVDTSADRDGAMAGAYSHPDGRPNMLKIEQMRSTFHDLALGRIAYELRTSIDDDKTATKRAMETSVNSYGVILYAEVHWSDDESEIIPVLPRELSAEGERPHRIARKRDKKFYTSSSEKHYPIVRTRFIFGQISDPHEKGSSDKKDETMAGDDDSNIKGKLPLFPRKSARLTEVPIPFRSERGLLPRLIHAMPFRLVGIKRNIGYYERQILTLNVSFEKRRKALRRLWRKPKAYGSILTALEKAEKNDLSDTEVRDLEFKWAGDPFVIPALHLSRRIGEARRWLEEQLPDYKRAITNEVVWGVLQYVHDATDYYNDFRARLGREDELSQINAFGTVIISLVSESDTADTAMVVEKGKFNLSKAMAFIRRYAKKHGVIPTQSKIATDNGVSLRTVQRHMGEINAAIAEDTNLLDTIDLRLIKSDSDEAMVGMKDGSVPPGGIDLNPAMLNLQIKRDASGVPLPVKQQPILEMNIEGFYPVIINITPIPNLPLMLGFDLNGEGDTEIGQQYKYNAIEPEKISFLKN